MRPGSSKPAGFAPLPDPASLVLRAVESVPVTIVSGFLGSGKSTLINRWLRASASRDTAVIVNEFGEVGLDHLIVEHAEEDTVLLANGCLCCGLQSDLVTTLRSLMERRERRELPHYRRVIIETSGLADCAPVMQTLLSDPLRLSAYDLHEVVVTVDAEQGLDTLHRFPQARRQVAMADRLLLTKTDRLDTAQRRHVATALRQCSPAPVHNVMDASLEFTPDEPGRRAGNRERYAFTAPPTGAHNHDIETVVKHFDTPPDGAHLQRWLETCVADMGDGVLRIKGLVITCDHPHPLVIHCVQHVFERPVPLPGARAGSHAGWLEFIVESSTRPALQARIEEL